jgi:hypothetical protein
LITGRATSGRSGRRSPILAGIPSSWTRPKDSPASPESSCPASAHSVLPWARSGSGDCSSASERGRPRGARYSGICLGLQPLAEGAANPRASPDSASSRASAEVRRREGPQIGWNGVRVLRPDPVRRDPGRGFFYYANSFYPPSGSGVLAVSEYGNSRRRRGMNVRGVQFHPERAGRPACACSRTGGVMLAVRVIPVPRRGRGQVVKGVGFEGPRPAGDPVELAGVQRSGRRRTVLPGHPATSAARPRSPSRQGLRADLHSLSPSAGVGPWRT